jgi:hypothetical protein
MTDEKRLEVIRKLLAKAEGTDNPDEAAVYSAKAEELMVRYSIDEAMLAAANRSEPVSIITRHVTIQQPYGIDKSVLLHNISRHLNVNTIRYSNANTGRRGRPKSAPVKMVLIGFETDIDLVEMLFTSLLVQASHGMLFAPRGFSPGESAANRRAWLSGFTTAVSKRIEEMYQKAAEEEKGMSTALVLRDRKAQVDDAFADAFPDVVKVSRALSGTGTGEGYRAGMNAEIGSGRRIGGHTREIG